MPNDGMLFNGPRLEVHLAQLVGSMESEVDQTLADALLVIDAEGLAEQLAQNVRLDVPIVKFEERHALDPAEVTTLVPGPFQDDERLYERAAMEHVIVIPFEGPSHLFSYCPSSIVPNRFPRGRVHLQNLIIAYQQTTADSSALKREIDADEALIKSFLEPMRTELVGYNAGLEGHALARINARKEKILAARGALAELRIPVRERPGAPATYAANIRMKVPIHVPKAPPGTFKPEAAIDDKVFDQIVAKLHTMAVAIERTPRTFSTLEEMDLRNFFLVLLNDQFEGEAMGEVFNAAGKADILIRHEDRNIFIVEFKKWAGPKSVSDALDQLLRYLCWRDTKAALVVFNDRRDFSAVLEKLDATVRAHECCVRSDGKRGETDFRYVFRRKGDVDRLIRLAVLVFDVAQPAAA